jgi:hypothetical protein
VFELDYLPIKTDRERAFIAAGAAFYNADLTVTYEARRDAYSKAMKRVHESSPGTTKRRCSMLFCL